MKNGYVLVSSNEKVLSYILDFDKCTINLMNEGNNSLNINYTWLKPSWNNYRSEKEFLYTIDNYKDMVIFPSDFTISEIYDEFKDQERFEGYESDYSKCYELLQQYYTKNKIEAISTFALYNEMITSKKISILSEVLDRLIIHERNVSVSLEAAMNSSNFLNKHMRLLYDNNELPESHSNLFEEVRSEFNKCSKSFSDKVRQIEYNFNVFYSNPIELYKKLNELELNTRSTINRIFDGTKGNEICRLLECIEKIF